MAQREESANGYRLLTSSNETTSDKIDDCDVIGVKCVAQTQGVCNDSSRGKAA